MKLSDGDCTEKKIGMSSALCPPSFRSLTIDLMASLEVDYSALSSFEPIELLRLPETHRLVTLSYTMLESHTYRTKIH